MLAIGPRVLESPPLSFKERCTQHITSIFRSCRQWSASIRMQDIPSSLWEKTEKIFRRIFDCPKRLTINENAERQCPIVAEEIKRLQALAKRINIFINNQPALHALVLKTIQEHTYPRPSYSSEPVKGSLEDPLKKLLALDLRRMDLQFGLDTRKRFIQRHEVITDWLKNHLHQTTAEDAAEFQSILFEWMELEIW